MPPYISALSVMLLMTDTLCKVSESAAPVVKVEYNGTAVLPCSGRCSGVISWTLYSKSSDILAECDQTSCRSVKEGYQMIYNQYQQRNFSLIITEADFSQRGLYVCDCDGTDLCDVQLQIEPLKSTVEVKPGESLLLNLYVSDPVEVIYSSTDPAGPSRHQICRVERRSVQLSREYSERASVSSDLELRGVKESDSGVYTVQVTENNEIICNYTVIIHGDSEAHGKGQNSGQGDNLPFWVVSVVTGVASGVLLFGLFVMILWHRRKSVQYHEGHWRKREMSTLCEEQKLSLPAASRVKS